MLCGERYDGVRGAERQIGGPTSESHAAVTFPSLECEPVTIAQYDRWLMLYRDAQSVEMLYSQPDDPGTRTVPPQWMAYCPFSVECQGKHLMQLAMLPLIDTTTDT